MGGPCFGAEGGMQEESGRDGETAGEGESGELEGLGGKWMR